MRLLYVPGLISLIGIPVFLFVFPIQTPEEYKAFRVFLPTEEKDSLRYSRYSICQAITNKKITAVDMSENEADAYMNSTEAGYFTNRRFNFINSEIERLAFTHDTSKVLKVTLGEENTLHDFVQLYNIATIYLIKRYAFVDNDFYFFANPPPQHNIYQDLYISSPDIPEPVPAYKGPSFWEVQERKVSIFIREIYFYLHGNYFLIIGFILLIAVPAFIRIRRPIVKVVRPAQRHVVL
jgi:hypothetical protein